MAMIDLDVDENVSVGSENEKTFVIGMKLRGEHPAAVELCLSSELASTWSSACAGVDPEELEDDEVEDGVGELLNMICGAAKTALGETGTLFELGIPTPSDSKTLGIENPPNQKEVRFSALADGQPLEITIRLP